MATSAISAKATFVVIDSIPGLEGFASEWSRLCRRCGASPFQTPEWLIPWTRHLWRGGTLQVLALRSEDRLAAVAPFFIWGDHRHSEPRCLSLLGCGVSDYLDIVSEPASAAMAADAVSEWIVRHDADWDFCDLQDVPADSVLLEAAGRHSGYPAASCNVCPILRLRPTFAFQLAAADATLRRNLRVAEKRLRGAGNVEFVRAGSDRIDLLLNRLFDLHTGRWQQRGESGVLATAALRSFHREVAHGFHSAGMLRLYGLMLNRDCLAVQYNFSANGSIYAYLAGFDPGWWRSSPGAVLLAHSIEDAIAEGAGEFDFLRDAEAYKYDWGAVDSHTKSMRIPLCDLRG